MDREQHKQELRGNAFKWIDLLGPSHDTARRLSNHLMTYRLRMLLEAPNPFEEPAPVLSADDETLFLGKLCEWEEDDSWEFREDVRQRGEHPSTQPFTEQLYDIDAAHGGILADVERARLFALLLATPHLRGEDRVVFERVYSRIMLRLTTYSKPDKKPNNLKDLLRAIKNLLFEEDTSQADSQEEANATGQAMAYGVALSQGVSLERGIIRDAARWTGYYPEDEFPIDNSEE